MNTISIGSKVRALPTMRARRLAVDFPGWGDPNYADFLLEPIVGQAGTVTDVESHGNNPWTRFSVRWADGTRSVGLVLGKDIEVVR